VYIVEKHAVVTVPQIFQETALETWPCWSPDGKYLYFSSAPLLWSDFKTIPPDNLDKVRYSLMRVSYDETRDVWGGVDTVLSANQTSASITQPRISPDGKFVVFCRHEYGPSPYLQKSSDLFIMDLGTGHVEPLAINSEWSESWHSWSSNGRWLAFSSKRNSGILGRIYLCHIDSCGKAAKPFILPQTDPGFYDSFIKVYNIPEFSTSRFTVRQQDLVSAIRSSEKLDVNVPAVTGATPAIQRKAE
jgi:Tol biopolymer transport system component